MTTVRVYVPAEDADELHEAIWPGSGIVGSEVGESGRLRLDFEGDQEIFDTYDARVARAAERHLYARSDGSRGYMTRACAFVDFDQVIEVGSWDPVAGELEITNKEALSEWLA